MPREHPHIRLHSVLRPIIRILLVAALLLAAQGARANPCPVPGGDSSSPTDLVRYLNNQACDEFVLQDGWYTFPNLTRPGITIRAEHAGQAQAANGIMIDAPGVTIDGISRKGEKGPVTVRAPGATIKNCHFSEFGKTSYGMGVWIWDESLSAAKITVVKDNIFENWGGAGGPCVAIGTKQDGPHVMEEISVHVLNNRFLHGPTTFLKPGNFGSSAIQAFNPFLASGNCIDTLKGPGIENKTKNSKIIGNTIVNCIAWGALYNRAFGNNQWIGNVVMHSDCGFQVFQGDHILFENNVFYDVKYFGLIKNFNSGTHDVTFRRNTFWQSTGRVGIFWDKSMGGTLSGIIWKDNVFCETKGRAIEWDGDYDRTIWNEDGNVYWHTPRPAQPTTGSAGSSVEMDPKLAGAPDNFAITAEGIAGKGAPWPPSH